MAIRADVEGGVCGFHTTVEAASPDGMNVAVRIVTDCPRVQALAAEISEIDAFQEVLRKPLIETTPARLAARHGLHPTCPVPIGVLKAVEAAAGLALAVSLEIALTRTEE